MNYKIKYLIIGIMLIVIVFFIINATSNDTNSSEVGRYQISAVGGNNDLVWVIDTKTGNIKQLTSSGKVKLNTYFND